MSTGAPSPSPLAEPLTLPCGLTLPNRIYKAAMAETLGAPNGDPSAALVELYRLWADSGAGMLITGDIGVSLAAADATAVRLYEHSDLTKYARWADVVHAGDVRLLGQIFHMGRQASRTVAWRPIAPSATPPVLGLPLFGAARALTTGEIAGLIGDFASAAGALESAGFDGVEVHAAHGYLVGSFLSPFSNRRTDDWGGTAEKRARFLLEVIRAIRSRVDPGFAVAVKINASDFRPGGLEAADSAHIVGLLDGEGVDLIEVSGAPSSRRAPRCRCARMMRASRATPTSPRSRRGCGR
jgi:2,4-dienoyl-CoA reductase-like NADH-dependent reductase (Old Yellow Enzyme family)